MSSRLGKQQSPPQAQVRGTEIMTGSDALQGMKQGTQERGSYICYICQTNAQYLLHAPCSFHVISQIVMDSTMYFHWGKAIISLGSGRAQHAREEWLCFLACLHKGRKAVQRKTYRKLKRRQHCNWCWWECALWFTEAVGPSSFVLWTQSSVFFPPILPFCFACYPDMWLSNPTFLWTSLFQSLFLSAQIKWLWPGF